MNQEKVLQKRKEFPQEKRQRIVTEKIKKAIKLLQFWDEQLSQGKEIQDLKGKTEDKENMRLAIMNYKTGTEESIYAGSVYLYRSVHINIPASYPVLTKRLKSMLYNLANKKYYDHSSQLGFYFGYPKKKS